MSTNPQDRQGLTVSQDHAPSIGSVTSGQPATWYPMSAIPGVGFKFIALYNDGSGACMYWRYDDGLIDQDGEGFAWAWPLKNADRWAYLPQDLEFWCETLAEDPVVLRLPPSSAKQVVGESSRDANNE